MVQIIELTKEQRAVEDSLMDWLANPSPYVSLSGYAGTGKTTLVGHFARRVQQEAQLKVRFLAFTGKAASVLRNKMRTFGVKLDFDSCSTIHSYLYECKGVDSSGKLLFEDKLEYDRPHLLIVDEASMVTDNIFRDLMKTDIPVVFVGDPGQLPPINSPMFEPLLTTELALKEIHRQALDNPIIRLASQVRHGEQIAQGVYDGKVAKMPRMSPQGMEQANNFLKIVGASPDTMVLCGKNYTRTQMNKKARMSQGRTSPLPMPGERLVCLQNDKEHGIMNGQLFYAHGVQILEDDLALSLEFSEEPNDPPKACLCYAKGFHSKSPGDLRKKAYTDKEVLELMQRKYSFLGKSTVMFDYGYALSVHKAQGSEWERILLVDERLPNSTSEDYFRWLYTGITRAKDKLLILS